MKNKVYEIKEGDMLREIRLENGIYMIENSVDTPDFRRNFEGYVTERTQGSVFNDVRKVFNKLGASLYSSKQNLLQKIFSFFFYPTPHGLKGGNILDIGCGSGMFLSLLPAEFDKRGLEISCIAAEYARTKYGLTIYEGAWEEVSISEKFDVIRASHVIEHFSDPHTFTSKCSSMLSPNGKLIIYTPNTLDPSLKWFGAYWYGFFDKTHKCMLNVKILKDITEKHDLKMVQAETYYMGIFTGSLAWKYGVKSLIAQLIITLVYMPLGLLFSKFGRGEALMVVFEKRGDN